MISKSQLKKIVYIQRNIFDKDHFHDELFRILDLYSNQKITKIQFSSWLDSWEATAELDMDPNTAKRISRSYSEIKLGKTPHKSWEDFKRSVGLS